MIFRSVGTISSGYIVLIPMSDDPSHTWSSVRRVSKSVCAVCATTARRVFRKEESTKAKSSSDVIRNRSTIIRVVGGNLCQTTSLSIKSVYKTLRRRADMYYMPMAITFTVVVIRNAASTTCVNLQVCGVSVFLCAGVVGQRRHSSAYLYTVRLRITSTETWGFVNSTRVKGFRM